MLDAGLPVRAFFTERSGGTSVGDFASLNVAGHVGDSPEAVARNRALVSEQAGAPVTFLAAEHGVRVARIDAPTDSPPVADILLTTTPGVALAAIAADCVPFLLHDPMTGAVAAVHAGREGLFKGAVDAAVAAMLDLRPSRVGTAGISAAIGPAICGSCYEVPADMRARVGARHPVAVSSTRWGTPSLDIPRAIETRLAELGIDPIVRHRACTLEDERWFSHRRHAPTGRHAGVIVCEGPVGVSVPPRRDSETYR
ncbi:polyphenol oxidase family protein [Demequina zhanjiangensis]|uniref:Polyphenol oxidase family protein n=1 Tax=Demequina zhanjiangensis TaxID=3051659 RepID=A0ABT8G3G7_9MICO|nr:polyphenol oxidase family protein [Demequina sp. SYSU T00b26]MDN4473675.1 polyphenol oxidase family protein [Demequina sp. SYSU T00b26]